MSLCPLTRVHLLQNSPPVAGCVAGGPKVIDLPLATVHLNNICREALFLLPSFQTDDTPSVEAQLFSLAGLSIPRFANRRRRTISKPLIAVDGPAVVRVDFLENLASRSRGRFHPAGWLRGSRINQTREIKAWLVFDCQNKISG